MIRNKLLTLVVATLFSLGLGAAGRADTVGQLVPTGTSGHTIPFLDTANTWSGVQSFSDINTGNINAVGAVRAGSAQSFFWQSRSVMTSPANGNIALFNNAASDFGLLQLGGTTNAFPAIKRVGATIQFRFADDSNVTAITAGQINGTQIISSSLGTATAATGLFEWAFRSKMFSPADGIILFQNNAANDFNRLQFGGTTSSFPSLKRNATELQVRLADDSDFAPLRTGGLSANIATITSTTTLGVNNFTVLCDATAGAVTVNLPAVSGIAGRIYNVKKIDSSGNACTLDGNSSETIDGTTTRALSAQYQSVQIQTDGTAWWVL